MPLAADADAFDLAASTPKAARCSPTKIAGVALVYRAVVGTRVCTGGVHEWRLTLGGSGLAACFVDPASVSKGKAVRAECPQRRVQARMPACRIPHRLKILYELETG